MTFVTTIVTKVARAAPIGPNITASTTVSTRLATASAATSGMNTACRPRAISNSMSPWTGMLTSQIPQKTRSTSSARTDWCPTMTVTTSALSNAIAQNDEPAT